MIYVSDYGAVPDGAISGGVVTGTDNTAALQQAINAANGQTLVFEKGMYRHNSGLDITNRKPMVWQGSGPLYSGSQLLPAFNGGTAWDFSGTAAVQLHGMWMGDFFNPYTPAVGILRAPTQEYPGLDCDHYSDIFVTGKYSLADYYNFGCGSGEMDKCVFWNFFNGADAERHAAVFSLDNSLGATSAFATLGVSGSSNSWTLNACEFHEASGQSNTSFAPILLRGASDIVFNGGIVSGSSKLIICKSPGVNANPRRINGIGVRFENEGGTPQPTHIFNLYSTLEDSHFWGCMNGASSGRWTGTTPIACTWNGVAL